MKTTIYCTPTAKGALTFYLKNENKEHFLFNQNYRKGVYHYYKNGVSVDTAKDFSRVKNRDTAILKTMEKLPMYVRYVEKEYNLIVLDQTKKKLSTKRHPSVYREELEM